MFKFLDKNIDCKKINSSALAFLGDCVFEMLVRLFLVSSFDFTSKKLHEFSTKAVCATSQEKFLKLILKSLTQEEMLIFKRGRNAHTSHTPKNATNAQYHVATGLECLFGYLYLKGDTKRINRLFLIGKEATGL